MTGMLSAIRFFTILRVPSGEFHPRRLAACAPAAGLLVGLILACVDALALRFWSVTLVSALDVVFLAVISGALHLDGLADTADGLYAGRTREKALAVMKDSRTGAMGVVAVACCLLVKWAGIHEIDSHRFWLLMLIPAYSRATVLFGMRFLPYGRSGEGTARAFFDEPLSAWDFRWVAVLVLLSLFAGRALVMLNLGFACTTAVVLWFYKKRMGCITGDMLGAMIEVVEVVLMIGVTAGLE